ncbi:MAG: PQQ-binding-like beta-propeller repeat protein [Thermaceae bacterium]|nr:PQQ-binding-like beta-propeller repeat protein [Thermaceae bacterium]
MRGSILKAALFLGLAAGSVLAGGPTQEMLDNAANDTSNWLMYNKDYLAQRYSSLDQINTSNVASLKKVCTYALGENGSFQSSPIVYGGVLYITSQHVTAAINATNCKPLWRYTYKPSGPEPFTTNRGVAIYDGVVVRGTTDAHLIALNSSTGKLLWNVKVADSSKGYFLSAAPIVWNGMIFIGTAGADWGVHGEMYAYDIKSGQRLWTFDVIPTGNQPGADTWQKAESTTTGGGSMWTSFTLDPQTGLLYVSVGNPAPDFAPEYRPGANLYTDSVVVLDAKTGQLSHYYQQIPNDSHDWDTAAAPVVYDSAGAHYMAVGTKGGYVFGYDEGSKQQSFKTAVTTILNADVKPTPQGVRGCPGTLGGVEWNGPAYDPQMETLFVPSVDWCGVYKLGEVRYVQGQLFFGGTNVLDPSSKARGWIVAMDAKTGQPIWRYHAPTPMVAAVTPTAGGLLFTGDLNGDFLALDSKTGKVLYRNPTGGAMAGGIVTYAQNGKQYVAAASGNASRTIWNTTGNAKVVIYALP